GRGHRPRNAGPGVAGRASAPDAPARGLRAPPDRRPLHRRGGRAARHLRRQREAASIPRGACVASRHGRSRMNCLDDRRLVDVHFGGGTEAEQAHVRRCIACTVRARALAEDLARVDTVLRSTTPPRRSAAHRTPVWHWAPTAVALVLALAV